MTSSGDCLPARRGLQDVVTAGFHIGLVGLVFRPLRLDVTGLGRLQQFGHGNVAQVVAADRCCRGLVAQPHARSVYDTDIFRGLVAERLQDVVGTGQFAGDGIAYPDGDFGRRGLAFLDHIEVVVERRHLIDLGLGEAHLAGQGGEMSGRQMAVLVLDQVQVFDQQIMPSWLVPQKFLNVLHRRRLGLPAFRECACPGLAATARAHRFEIAWVCVLVHDDAAPDCTIWYPRRCITAKRVLSRPASHRRRDGPVMTKLH